MVVDADDPWAAAAAPTIHDELEDAGFDTTMTMAPTATQCGSTAGSGLGRPGADAADLQPVPEPDPGLVHLESRSPRERTDRQNWTGFANPQFDQLVLTASRQLNPDTAATIYQQADTQLWDEMVSLPLYPEPSALVWSRTIGGVTPTPLEHQPALVRAAVGGSPAGVDQQHHAVAAGAVGLPIGRLQPSGGADPAWPGIPHSVRYHFRTPDFRCSPVGVAE